MYYTKQVGFGPFKKWVLMEKVSPRHKEQRADVKDGFIFTENGKRPISSAKIFLTQDGYIMFEGTTKNSVKAESFEAFTHGFVFRTPDGTQGYVARNGNIVNPKLEGYTYKDGGAVTGVEVDGRTIIFQMVANDSNEIYYTVADALSGLQVFPGKYTSYKFGDKQEGIPSSILILGNKDGTMTIANNKFAILSDSATKYEKSDETLYILSNTPSDPKHKTVLEGFDLTSAKTEQPVLKFMEKGVVDFDTFFRELITYNGKTSSVYDVVPYSEGETVAPKFTKEGTIKNVSPMFCDYDIYAQQVGDKTTLLYEDGQECKNPELEGFKSIRDRHGFAYIIEVETKNGVKQGLFRSGDLSTLFPPCDQIRVFGDRPSKKPSETESLFVATHGDTFAVGKLEQYKSDAYLPPEILIGFNNYFNPQLTSEDCKLYAQDSYGRDGVLDCSARNKAPVFTEMVAYASKELGYPAPTDKKPTEYIESGDILVK